MKLTVQELSTIIEVINVRSANKNSTIKDIRLLNNVALTLKEFLPKAPMKPLVEEGMVPTQELMAEYDQDVIDYPNFEIEVELMQTYWDVIKAKFISTNVFFDDQESRTKLIELSDKLGV